MRRVSIVFIILSVYLSSNPVSAGSAEFRFDSLDLRYRCIGPNRGGRVTAVTGIPSRPSTFFMGSTGGGVWKTVDYGQTWINVSDGFFETGSIGALAVAPSDPDIVYAGTGSEGLRSNVIRGRGIYRSVNSGESWTFAGLKETGQIGAVLIHPNDPDRVWAAALGQPFAPNPERGVYRTTNGGASWEKVLFLSDSTGAVDLEFHPGDPNTIYAAMWRAERKPWTIISGSAEGGVYKSTDGGDTWRRLTRGLPSGLIGKSDLSVTPADPDRLYVLMEAKPGGGLYRSDDCGESFRLVSDYERLLERPFYYTNVHADPSLPDRVYVNCTSFFRSDDGGSTWTRLGNPHGDNHDMWIHPRNSNLYIQSNDGGANVTRDGGQTWSTQHNQPTAEIYTLHVDDAFPYYVYGGQQDNTTIGVPSFPPYPSPSGPSGYWRVAGGCETGPAVPRPGAPHIFYSNCKGRFGRYNRITGQEKQYYVGAANMYGHNPEDLKFRFQRVAPILVSPHDPDVIYHASQYVHRTTDEGVTWEIISPDLTAFEPDKQVISGTPITRDITGEEVYSALYALAESPLRQGVIWAGSNDGPVHVTTDGGSHWKNVTPPGLPPGGRVQTLEASPHNPAKAYAAVYRILLGDYTPYLYRTEDYGETWTLLTTGENGIPADCAVRVVREDPDREGLLYAGTETGMFLSFDDGMNWILFQLNLPKTQVTDIRIFRKDLILSTMGRGFYILDDLSPLHQWDNRMDTTRLFDPSPAFRLQLRIRGRSASVPEYRRPGAFLDYYLPRDLNTPLRLDIYDSRGERIRSWSSDPGKNRSADSALKTRAGHHRLIWDMRHEGPRDPRSDIPGRGGPLAVPGNYTVRLRTGDSELKTVLTLLMDPRVEADDVTAADLQEQLDLALKTRNALSRARKLNHEIGILNQILSKGPPKTRSPVSPEQ
ncbi:MAG TPA: hypothetical protein ENN03_10475, partial [bacterium]|nr:hypothetical protein [bacterium]